MITVAGFNTAIDCRVDLGQLRPGEVQRATGWTALPGGKGLHVAQTVAALGEPVRLLGLEDAAHSEVLRTHLLARGVEWHPIRTSGDLRQCLALRESDGRVTEILGRGPAADDGVQRALVDGVLQLLETTDVLVLSGSLPPGLDPHTYALLVTAAIQRSIPCLVDASGEVLRYAVAAGPTIVKPNADEASALLNAEVCDVPDAVACARELHERGVACPVITLGALGAIAFDGVTVWRAWSDPAQRRNPVGSGDCFLAAMAVGVARHEAFESTLVHAIACGAANAETEETGFVEATLVAAWKARVQVQRLEGSTRSSGHGQGAP